MSRVEPTDGEANAPEIRATPFSGSIAVGVTLAVGVALAIADGSPGPVVAAIAGALVAALGVRAAQSGENARRAVGSVGIVAGSTALAGVVLFGSGPVPLLVGAAMATATLNATVSFGEAVERPALQSVWRSATVLSVGSVLAFGISAGVFATLVRLGSRAVADIAAPNAISLLVTLQVEVLLIAELLQLAVPVLDRWLPEDRDLRAETLGRFDFRVEDAPKQYWVVFGLQVLLALVSWGPRWVAAFLDALSVFGSAVELLLFSGVLHLPLAAIIFVLVGVLVARVAQILFVAWAGSDPPQAIAHAAGGVVTLGVATLLAVAFSGNTGAFAGTAGQEWATLVQEVGVTATVGGLVAATLFAVAFGQRVLVKAVTPWVGTDSASGFAVTAGSLVIASLVVAYGGGSAVVAFIGVAGALVVHDLGTNAVELGAQVGTAVETRDGEAAHAVGSLVVGALGVTIAWLTAFVMGSMSISLPAWRARLAVALLLVSVLCFAVLFERL